ncbi:hypothetical protein EON66_02455 [archaeon]|nr:MAG: hypothetical protein EON66_02455 [archaeon]
MLLRVAFDGTTLYWSNDAVPSDAEPWVRSAAGAQQVYLSKLRRGALTADALASEVVVNTVPRSVTEALYAAVHTAFMPSITRDGARAGNVDEGTRALLADLDKSLASVVRRGGATSMAGISSVSDEFRFWSDASRGGSRDKERAAEFARALEPAAGALDRMDSLSFVECIDALPSVQSSLAAVASVRSATSDKYPAARWRHLLATFVSTMVRGIESKCERMNIAALPAGEARMLLLDAEALCAAVAATYSQLVAATEGEEALSMPAARTSEHAALAPVSELTYRITSIAQRRAVVAEVLALLGGSSTGADAALTILLSGRPFSGITVAHAEFEDRLIAFDRRLDPVEPQLQAALQARLAEAASVPEHLVAQVRRFRNLLARPSLLRSLAAQRNTILSQMLAQVDSMTRDVKLRQESLAVTAPSLAAYSSINVAHVIGGSSGGAPSAGAGRTTIVSEIGWMQAMAARFVQLQQQCTPILKDLPGFEKFVDACKDGAQHVARLRQETLELWTQGVEAAIRDKALGHELSGRLIEFDADGNVRVTYSEALVALERYASLLPCVRARGSRSVHGHPETEGMLLALFIACDFPLLQRRARTVRRRRLHPCVTAYHRYQR